MTKASANSCPEGSNNRPLGLQTKFLLGLAAILFCFSTFSASLIYLYEKKNLGKDAYRQTDLES